METQIVFPGVVSAELVVRTMWEALGLDLLAHKCLLWLVIQTGSLPLHVFQPCLIHKSLPLCLCKQQHTNAQDADHYDGVPKDDAGTLKDNHTHKQGYNDDYDDGIQDHNMSGGEGSSDGDQEFQDNSGSYSDGGSDEDEDDDHDDDIDTEDYDDDDDDDDDEKTDEEDEDDREDDRSNSEESTHNNKHFPPLKNARDVYTSEDTFRLFEHERRKTRTLDIDVLDDMDLSDRGLEITYKVGKSWQFDRRYTVTVLPMDGIVECSCKYFESSGVLCSHAQVALKCLRIDKIPDRYRLQKDKNISPGLAEGVDTHNLIENQEEHHTDFNRYASPGLDIISDFQADEEIRTDYIDPPLLRHASEVFSSNIFNMFQEEYKKSEYLIAREADIIIEGRLIVHYVVEKTGNYSYYSIPRRTVCAVPNDGTVNCNCKKFEKTGLLCCHAIVVLDYLCIVKIPGQYILDKFRKDGTVSTVQEIHGPEYPHLKSFLIYRVFNEIFDELFVVPNRSEESVRLFASRLDKLIDVLKFIKNDQESVHLFKPFLDKLKDVLKGMRNDQDSEEVNGDLQLASGKCTSAATEERTVKESTVLHNDLHAQNCSTLQVFGKVDQSTIISGASSCSSPPTNFGTESDAAISEYSRQIGNYMLGR